jgi:hypothetical protein
MSRAMVGMDDRPAGSIYKRYAMQRRGPRDPAERIKTLPPTLPDATVCRSILPLNDPSPLATDARCSDDYSRVYNYNRYNLSQSYSNRIIVLDSLSREIETVPNLQKDRYARSLLICETRTSLRQNSGKRSASEMETAVELSF